MVLGRKDFDLSQCPLLALSGIQTSVFDLDQIQGRRARTIVNDGSAFCQTGVGSHSNAELLAVMRHPF
jgi:hypothetical protein